MSVVRTWTLSAVVAVAAFAVCIQWKCTFFSTLGWTLLAAYLPSYLDGSELTGERTWPAFSRWMATYGPKGISPAGIGKIPTRMHFENQLDPNQQVIVCSHPHGIMSLHHGIMMEGIAKPSFQEVIPLANRRHLAASIVFRIPLWREYFLWLGAVDARREIADKMLKQGKSLVIIVGGIAEQMLSQRGEQAIYIKHRKGHIRLALKYGIPLVPCYAFGETELYTHSKWLLSFRQSLAKKLSIAFIWFSGSSWFFPLLPHTGCVIDQVVGKPIQVAKKDKPTKEEIDAVHDKYVAEVTRIFNKYKAEFGYQNQELMIY